MTIAFTSAALIATATPLVTTAPMHLPLQEAQAQPSDAQQEEAAPPATTEAETPADLPDSSQAEDTPEARDQAADRDVIVVTGETDARKKDPLVQVNEAAFQVTQAVDGAVVKPIADVYEEGLPSPVRKGLRNFFRNLLEPITALNDFLQLKPGRAFKTLGRFAINSTIGLGGVLDVAEKKPFNLPYRRNGFANTLGYYGVGPGPFLVLPLVGATTLRDVLGNTFDQSIIPFAVGKPFNTPVYAIPAFTVNSLEWRITFDERIEQINNSDDPYFALRESYLCRREADIAALKNRPPPRDCSIDAILGLTAEAAATATPIEDVSAAETAPVAEEPAVEPAAQPPAIIFKSIPVVQPLPADYVPAPAPTN